MKRVGRLFDSIADLENLERAARRAERGKRYSQEVLRFNLRREDELLRLREELARGTWAPGGHRHFVIREPKRRWISAAPYRDRVVHHALRQVIEPVLDRRLIFDTWANRRGKGSHRAVLRYQAFSSSSRYALKMDIRQYFASIDHRILGDQLGRVFKEATVLEICERIIEGGRVPEPYSAYFPGDDLFTPQLRAQGLPIGNLTSQLWANTYLSTFDHWVKQSLRARGYLRFVDDFLLVSDSKRTLVDWREAIIERLSELRLTVHPRKCVIRDVREGVPFLGYVVWPDRIRVRGATVRRFRRRLRARGRGANEVDRCRSLDAWRGHVQLAGSWRRVVVGQRSVAGGR